MARKIKRAEREPVTGRGELDPADRPLIENPLGHDETPDPDEPVPQDVMRDDVGAKPRSQVTGRHDEGSGANETVDGLDELEESLRRNTEDVPVGEHDELDDLPVFDRAEVERKI